MSKHGAPKVDYTWDDWLAWYDLVASAQVNDPQYGPADWPRILLWNVRDLLPAEVLSRALAHIWTQVSDGLVALPDVQFPTYAGRLPHRLTGFEWRELFEMTGYISEEHESFAGAKCDKPSTLFRFAEHADEPCGNGNQVGWAWTTTPEDARRFEVDYKAQARDGCIWSVTGVEPERILAHFHFKPLPAGGFENEYVFEPRQSEVVHFQSVRRCTCLRKSGRSKRS